MTRTQKKLILICICASLSSISIVLGKYLAINLGESIRISFENLPILFAGFFFGPFAGVSVGVVADLVGCLLVGYSINPVITLGAAAIGFVSGLIGKSGKISTKAKIPAAVISSHLLGSVLIKTIGLHLYFRMPFFATLAWRSVTYLLIITAECTILFLLSQSRALTRKVESIAKSEEKK